MFLAPSLRTFNVSEELSSVETNITHNRKIHAINVSEELSSVETSSFIRYFFFLSMFQKNLVVWNGVHPKKVLWS